MADLVGVQVVGVRGVDQRDTGVERGVDGRHRPRGVGPALDGHRHAAEADRADGEVGEGALLHGSLLGCWSVVGRTVAHERLRRADSLWAALAPVLPDSTM